jgi:hypothetical protein
MCNAIDTPLSTTAAMKPGQVWCHTQGARREGD